MILGIQGLNTNLMGRFSVDLMLSEVPTELGELLEGREVDGRLLVQPLGLAPDELGLRR